MQITHKTVQSYLYALLDEAKRRGSYYPQTKDEQTADSEAIYRVCDIVDWYGKQGYPSVEELVSKHTIRMANAE